MLGAIIGDIIGSRFEWDNIRSKDFELFHEKCDFTDDTVMTIAIALSILDTMDNNYSGLPEAAIKNMQDIGRCYSGRGYGSRFYSWLMSNNPKPYMSYGNGAAMRVSATGFAAKTLTEAKRLSHAVTKVTHNHIQGIKGAEATAVAIFLAREAFDQHYIRRYIQQNYYPLDYTLDEIRIGYGYDVTCQGSVPQAIEAFLESTSYEDAVRNAISIGGDSDTIAAIAGGIAEAFFGIPDEIVESGKSYLDDNLLGIVNDFYKIYGKNSVHENAPMCCPLCKNGNIVFTADFPPLFVLDVNNAGQIKDMYTDDVEEGKGFSLWNLKNSPVALKAHCPNCKSVFLYGISMTYRIELFPVQHGK